LSAACSEIGFGPREFFRVTREESNFSALAADVSRQHQSKSARPATDQGNFIAQFVLRCAKNASGYPTAE
jgi:hypothetical protein